MIAENGAEALEICSNHSFDFIIMDIQMPIMDGITATYELRKRGDKTPILGLTANSDDECRTESVKAGMSELFTKPMSLQVLTLILYSSSS